MTHGSLAASPHSQAAKNKGSSPKPGKYYEDYQFHTDSKVVSTVTGASQKPQAAAVPALSMLNRVSSFFGWTKSAPSAPPIDNRIAAIDKRRQGRRSSQLSFFIFDSIY
jgi:hypothetical protein